MKSYFALVDVEDDFPWGIMMVERKENYLQTYVATEKNPEFRQNNDVSDFLIFRSDGASESLTMTEEQANKFLMNWRKAL